MWSEPLTVASTPTRRDMFVTSVHDGSGAVVAHVACLASVQSRCGYFGAITIDDKTGGPRQLLRAMTLLTRDALRFAQALGITNVMTDVPDDPQLRAFAAKMAGLAPDAKGRMAGDCTQIRSNALDVTDEDGNDRPTQQSDTQPGKP